jgi:hypothetical protein
VIVRPAPLAASEADLPAVGAGRALEDADDTARAAAGERVVADLEGGELDGYAPAELAGGDVAGRGAA